MWTHTIMAAARPLALVVVAGLGGAASASVTTAAEATAPNQCDNTYCYPSNNTCFYYAGTTCVLGYDNWPPWAGAYCAAWHLCMDMTVTETPVTDSVQLEMGATK